MLKRLIMPTAAILLLTCMLSACAEKQYSWVVKIDDCEIDPSTYLTAQMRAYIEAEMLLEQPADDITTATIEGTDGAQWINNRTLENLKDYCLINREFQQRGLSIDQETADYINKIGKDTWESVGSLYSANGLTLNSYIEYLTYLYKNQMVFNSIYSTGGECEITDFQVKDYLGENLAKIQGFQLAKVNDDGSEISDEQCRQLEEMAKNACDRLDDGEEICGVANEYMPLAGKLLGSSADFSDCKQYVITGLVNKTNSSFDENFISLVMATDENKSGFYDMGQYYLVFKRIELYTADGEYLDLKQSVINLLKSDEYMDFVNEGCKDMKVKSNDEAIKYYSPSKIKIEY